MSENEYMNDELEELIEEEQDWEEAEAEYEQEKRTGKSLKDKIAFHEEKLKEDQERLKYGYGYPYQPSKYPHECPVGSTFDPESGLCLTPGQYRLKQLKKRYYEKYSKLSYWDQLSHEEQEKQVRWELVRDALKNKEGLTVDKELLASCKRSLEELNWYIKNEGGLGYVCPDVHCNFHSQDLGSPLKVLEHMMKNHPEEHNRWVNLNALAEGWVECPICKTKTKDLVQHFQDSRECFLQYEKRKKEEKELSSGERREELASEIGRTEMNSATILKAIIDKEKS